MCDGIDNTPDKKCEQKNQSPLIHTDTLLNAKYHIKYARTRASREDLIASARLGEVTPSELS